MSSESPKPPSVRFTGYEAFVIAVLAFIQFTVILDFMILSPLGAMLMKVLQVDTNQFGKVVSGYAFAAGISGLMAAGFADRFDRKRLLMFFYTGFVLGTLFCAFSPDYKTLLIARIVTGFFGGVIGSISMAIVADVFPLERRGRVMGFIQSSFAAAQVLGLPVGLWLANHYGWHSGFLMIVGVSTLVGIAIMLYLKPVTAHLAAGAHRRNPLEHLAQTAIKPSYIGGFLATVLLSTGGFMLMPFGSTFTVENLGIDLNHLPMIYLVTGICSLVFGPLLGRASDAIGKYRMFLIGTTVGAAIILVYVRMGITPIWEVILLNIVLYTSISARMVSASALTSGVPDLVDRGAYMSISSALQQISGGIASWVAGLVVYQVDGKGPLQNYPMLGWIVTACMATCAVLMYQVHRIVMRRRAAQPASVPAPEAVLEH